MLRPEFFLLVIVDLRDFFFLDLGLWGREKKQEGPWALGLGNHSSSQSPATCMNFDRSAVSLRFNMGYVNKINRM